MKFRFSTDIPCAYCPQPATRQSKVDFRYLCEDCQPCWCLYLAQVEAVKARMRRDRG